jgi:hypothetical protein
MREYTSAPAEGEEERNPLAGVSFKLDGDVFECKGRLSVADMAELARQSMSGADTAEAATLALLAEPLAQAFGQEEYDRFRVHCREHHTPDAVYLQILSDLNEEIKAAVETATGRPTQPSSPSGTGDEDPGERISRVISFQDADVTVIGHPQPQDHKRKAVNLAGKEDAQTGARPAAKRPRQRRTG